MAKYESSEVDNLPIPTEDRTGRFPEDRELRRAGFRIYSRPKRGPAVWARHGQYYFHDEALALSRAEQKRKVTHGQL